MMQKKCLLSLWVVFFMARFALAGPETEYTGSVLRELWRTIKSDAYPDGEIPTFKPRPLSVITSACGDYLLDKALVRTGNPGLDPLARQSLWATTKRTLIYPGDLLPVPLEQKQVRPNAIALWGTMTIRYLDYTGVWAQGTTAVIGRASVATGRVSQENFLGKPPLLSYGLALKFARNPDIKERTTNAFWIGNNGGVYSDSYFDNGMSTRPSSDLKLMDLRTWMDLPTLVPTLLFQKNADAHAEYRSLRPSARAGIRADEIDRTPWDVQIVPRPVNRRRAGNRRDFRTELVIHGPEDGYTFDLFAVGGPRDTPTLFGEITWTDSAISWTSDHRLHFHHPKAADGMRLGQPDTDIVVASIE